MGIRSVRVWLGQHRCAVIHTTLLSAHLHSAVVHVSSGRGCDIRIDLLLSARGDIKERVSAKDAGGAEARGAAHSPMQLANATCARRPKPQLTMPHPEKDLDERTSADRDPFDQRWIMSSSAFAPDGTPTPSPEEGARQLVWMRCRQQLMEEHSHHVSVWHVYLAAVPARAVLTKQVWGVGEQGVGGRAVCGNVWVYSCVVQWFSGLLGGNEGGG